MINTLYKLFYNLQNTLPIVTALLVLIAIVLLILIVFLVVKAIRKSSKKKAPPKPQPLSTVAKEEKTDKKSVFALEEDNIFYRYSWTAKLLSRIGFYPKGKVASSFIKTIQLLRDQVGGNDYLYKLPWFLMVGPSDSGKSSILKYTDLPQPVGKPNFYPKGEKPGCDWSFFDDSVILDVRGDYFLEKDKPNSDDQWWSHLMTLLCRFRPKRPIDGIILTIPSSELVGDQKLDTDIITKRAEHVQNKLAVLSSRTGMRLPLYIVITKSDYIPGFKSISNQIPENLDQDIFGWSSPYPIEERYSSAWMEDAFSEMQDGLNYIQNEIFANGKSSDEADGVFLFPSSLQNLKKSLQIYTDNIFRENGFNKFYFLRGVYFCGDAEIDISAEKISGLSVDFGSNIPRLGSQKSGDALIGDEYKRQPRILFTRRLLGEKIFQEFGLARPDTRRLTSINRHVRILKAALVATVLIGVIGINKAHDRIQTLSAEILPVSNGLNNSLVRLQRISEMPNVTVDSSFFDEQTRRLFSMIDLLTKSSLRSFFLPVSWFGGLESKADRLIQFSYEWVFLRSLYYKIQDKIQANIDDPISNVAYQERNVIYTPPTKTKEFIQLKRYVDNLIELERAAQRFNQLKISKSLDNLSDICRTAFGYPILSKLKKNPKVHQAALGKASHPDIVLETYKESATKQLNELYDRFVNRVLNSETTFKGIRSLEHMIERFVESRYKNIPSISYLRAISQGVNNTVALIQTPGLNWIDNKVFNPDNTFIDLMANIESSQLFGTQVVTDLYQKTDRQFEKLKAELRDFESPLTGPLFNRTKENVLSEASKGLLGLRKNLNLYLKQNFIGTVKRYEFSDRIPEGRSLFWNKKGIEKAVALTEDFVRFTAETLPNYPADLQHILKLMAREQLHKSVMNLMGQSQTFVDRPIGNLRTVSEEVMRSQVRNLKNVTPHFIQLLRALEKSGNINAYIAIRDILLNQIFNILEVADNVLESENLYAFKDGDFNWWNGETGLANIAFNAQDKQSLQNYLDSQRDRALYLTNNFVRPVMALFGNNIFRLGSIDAPLLDKWIRLLQTSNDYQQKKPNTSIAKLEKFVGEELNTVGWNNCVKSLYQAEQTGDGDYFLGKMNAIRTAAFGRCRILLGEKTYDQYIQIKNFFERNLEGRFPFVKDPSDITYGEASIHDVRAFFKMFSAYKESTRQILAQSGEFGTPGAQALQFIDDLSSVEQFLQPFISNLEGTDTPGYNFNVEFRVLREAEQGGNKIADWTLYSGAKSINFRDDLKQGRWEFGAPVAIQLRWAKDTSIRPVSDPLQKSLNVSDTIATFGYTGQWAMLRLFLNHATSSTDMVVAKDPRPEILTFSVPVRRKDSQEVDTNLPEAQTRRSKVFIRVIPTIKSGDGQVNVVTVPPFPSKAPYLPAPQNPGLVYFSDLLTGKSMPLDGSIGAGKVGAPSALISGPIPGGATNTATAMGAPNTFSANINNLTSSLK